jgi:mannose-6-phosphate isomerase-like protein (cupin superfamily)
MKKGFFGHIEDLTTENTHFRAVLYTGEEMQLVLMSLAPHEEIGLEVHHENDQFFRFESGEGKVIIDNTGYIVHDGDAVIIPRGSQHNIINTSSEHTLTMYTIYAPPHHKDATVHDTKAFAETHEEDFDGVTTE